MEKQLPKNWVETELGKVFDIVTGNTPSKSFSEYYGYDYPWVKPGDINKAIKIFETEEFLSTEGFNKSRKIPKDSVMVTCIGNLGNVAIAGTELATNQQINTIVINHNLINKKFVYYSSQMLKPWLVENSTSTTISMVNKSNFEKAPFIFPPLPEQNRIVTKLDALFAQLEAIKSSMATVPLLLKDFRQQILTQAVTGNLKPFKKSKVLKLNDLGIWKGGGTPSKSNNSFWENGTILWTTAKDMKGLFLSNSMDKITESAVKGSSAILIPKNSILIVTRSGILRRILPISSNTIETTVNQDLKVLIPNERVNYKFLLYTLRGLEEDIRVTCMKSGTTVESVEFPLLKNYEINLPSLQEQQEIVSCIESLFAKADAIEKQYESLKAKINNLPQALLHKAFKGELTEQLESDGDARELLKEIEGLKKIIVAKPKTNKAPKEKLLIVAEPK